MAKNANAAGTGNQVVGKVFILYGTVKAVSPDGTVRVLAPNSPIYADDRIITESDGSVSLQFDGPPVTQLDLGRMTEIVIDEDVYAGVAPEVVSEAAAEAEQIQQSLLEGDQPIELEATAAGGVTGSGGGITVFNLDLDGSSVTPGSGAETTGIITTTVGTLGGVFGETPAPLYGVVTLTATESITEAAGQTITYTATVDNAPQGSDLVLTMNNGGTITIPAGETSGSAVGISSGDEDVYVDLSSITASITGATGGNYTSLDISDTATTSIIDTIDTTTVTLSAPASVTEDAASVTFTATLSNPAETAITITTNLGDISIAAGETTGTLVWNTADPDVYVDPSSITATVSGVTGGNFEAVDYSAATATAQITDTIDTTTVSLSAPASVTEDAASVTFTATLSNAAETAVTITTNLGDIHIDAGATTGTLVIPTLDPDVYVDPSSITATVTGVSGGNFEAVDYSAATATAQITDTIDTTTVTLSGPESVMEGDMITYTATVDNAPQGDLVITLDDDAGTQITILSGQLSGSSIPVAAPNVPDGGDTLTVGIADASGGNYEALDTDDTVSLTIGDHTPEGGSVEAMVDDEGLSGVPGGTDDIVVTPDPDLNEATFSGTLAFNFGGDGAGSVTFAAMDGTTGTVGTEEVTYSWDSDGNTLTATVSGGARDGIDLFTVEVTDTTTGAYTVTLLDNVLHEAGGNENNAAAGLTYTVTDSDGSAIMGTLNVTFNDDTPALLGAETNYEGQGELGHSGPVVHSYTGIPGPGEGGNTLVHDLGGPKGFGENFLAPNDDGSTGFINVSEIFGTGGMKLFGQTYNGFYINNNGNITFNESMYTYTPSAITGTTDNPMIAPFFADVDTRGGAVTASEGGTSAGSNLVWYDLDQANGVITITWDDVGYYSYGTDKVNAFQLRIFNQGDQNFSFEFRYENVDWTTGGASGGSGGLGGIVARAGWTAGDGVNFYELPQSGDQAAILALETTSNPGTAIDGNWVFNVVEGAVTVLPVDGSSDTVTVEDEQALGGINETESPVDGVGHVDGNIVNNVNWGADGFGSATTVSVGGVDFTIAPEGSTTVYWSQEGTLLGTESDGAAASLLVNSDGTYTYTLLDNLLLGQGMQGEQTDVLATVSITGQDADGDPVAVNVTLQVTDDIPVVGENTMLQMDDDALESGIGDTAAGDDTEATDLTGTLAHTYGADGAGTVLLTGVDLPTDGGFTYEVSEDGLTLTISQDQGGDDPVAVQEIELTDETSGDYTVTQLAAIMHPEGDTENNVEFTIQYQVTDSDGDTADGTLAINVDDDMPTAVDINSNQDMSGTNTNLLIVLDDSGSMSGWARDPQGHIMQDSELHYMTKLDVAKESIGRLLDAYDARGDIAVKLVAFNSSASEPGNPDHWMNIIDAKAALSGITAYGNTNYDAALTTAMSAFGDPGNIDGAQNVSYVLSDGVPNEPSGHAGIDGYGDGNSDVSISEWTSFVHDNNIVSFALGMGSSANQSALNPIAYNGVAPADTNAIVVDEWSDLGQTLVNTLHALPVSGTLGSFSAESSNFGADGGHVQSITLDSHTYTYNPAADGSIGVTGADSVGHGTFDTVTNTLTVTSDDGKGQIAVDMDNGKFIYTPPETIPEGGVEETIGFTLIDGDGDTASAQLNMLINVPDDDLPPI